jgi:large repetitive protein
LGTLSRLLVLGSLLLLPGVARAGGPAASAVPIADALGAVATDGAGVEARGQVGVRIDLGWARAPLRLPIEGALAPVVNDEVALRVGLFLGLTHRLTVGAQVPVSLASYSAAGQALSTGAGHVTGWDVAQGDLRLTAKLSLIEAGFAAMAVIVGLTLPTGEGGSFRGDGVMGAEPRLVFAVGYRGISLLANLGARLHGDAVAGDAAGRPLFAIGPEIVWAAALRWVPVPSVDVAVEAVGSETLPAMPSTRTVELIGSAAVSPWSGVALFAGAGRSLALDAARTDEVRIFLGVTWHPAPAPAPAPVPDSVPVPAPVPVPVPDGGGDRDGDGLPDVRDRCPDEPEDRDGFQDDDGCPDPDNDGDGVPDASDRCPDEPETRNGFEDEDGCPDTAPRVIATPSGPEPTRAVLHFGRGSFALDGDARRSLAEVAAAMAANPAIARVRIEGHSDREGSPRREEALSLRRAEAARAELIRLGVAPGRLEAVGYGATRPIAPLGQPENRRVELQVIP